MICPGNLPARPAVAFKTVVRSAFHHLRIAPASRKLLGIKFRKTIRGRIAKRWSYARYAALPFGWIRSTEKLAVMTKPLMQHWLQQGLTALIYVDDGIGYGRGAEAMQRKAAIMMADLDRLGFAVAMEKSDFTPKSKVEWCGFVWCTSSFTVTVPTEKALRFRAAIQSVRDRADRKIPAKDVAGVIGKIVSCGRALGRLAILLTRSLTREVAAAVKIVTWRGSLLLGEEALAELDYWPEHFLRLAAAGQPIRRPASSHIVKGVKMSTDAGQSTYNFLTGTSLRRALYGGVYLPIQIQPQGHQELPARVYRGAEGWLELDLQGAGGNL